MKKITSFVFLLISLHSFSQSPDIDLKLRQISAEKNDSLRFYMTFALLTISETNPVLDMQNAEIILLHGQKNNDMMCIGLGLACLGYDYRAFGNTTMSLKNNLKALKVAEESKSERLKAAAYSGIAENYMDLEDYGKAVHYGKAALLSASKVEVNLITIICNLTMGEIYLKMKKIDLALQFTQKAYELSNSTGIKDYLGGIYGQLGQIQAVLGNGSLALNYMNLALNEAKKIKSPKYINISYNAIADYYYSINKKDSALVYSKKAIAAVDRTAFSTMKLQPAKLLLDIYRKTNIDSAFKYSEMHKTANDSVFNIKAVQQAQLMTFEEDARQKELAIKNADAEDQRQENIQYVLIAFGLISFIIVFLLLSRSVIVNTKIITIFGVMALLIVFEFFNLLLHPLLERITHHTPIFMLLALVGIAALLVPMHHKLEKWSTQKLIEKNTAIRLANARRTIEKLEKKDEV